MSLYQEIVAAKIEHDNHESDLYFIDNDESRKILAKYPQKQENAKRFKHATTGAMWWDVPFAFEPFWEAKQKRGT